MITGDEERLVEPVVDWRRMRALAHGALFVGCVSVLTGALAGGTWMLARVVVSVVSGIGDAAP